MAVIGALRTPGDDRWYRLSLGALIVGAWVALAVWAASPFGGLLDHSQIEGSDLTLLFRLPIFVLGWTLMTIAMMLPGSLPLVNLFRRLIAARPDRARLLTSLLLGYLAIWAGFGLLAYLGDAVLHAGVDRWSSDAAAARVITPVILLFAGVYQFTPLKHACLDKCRSPYFFLVQHMRGRQSARDALRLGVDHGIFCVGCCWTLMLLTFAVGVANLAWMLAFGAVMAAERATHWGRCVTRPLGFALIVWSALYIARGTALVGG